MVSSATGSYHLVLTGRHVENVRACIVLVTSKESLTKNSHGDVAHMALRFLFSLLLLLCTGLFGHLVCLPSNSSYLLIGFLKVCFTYISHMPFPFH